MLSEVDQQSGGQHLGEQHLEGGHPQQTGDYGTGAWQGGFAGGIWEHDEDYDDKGWIFSVGGAGWPSGFQGRPGLWCTIFIDSGSSATVCGPQHFPDYPIVSSERLALYEPSGKPLKHYGQKEVRFVAEDGQNVNIKFDVANVVRPIVSVGKLQQDGKEVVLGKKSHIKECRGRRGVRRLGLFTIAALFFLRLQIAAGCATGPSLGKTTLEMKATDEVWAVEGPEVPACRPMTQSTRWTSSRARMRKWRDRRHVGFLPQRSRPRRRSSGITLLTCHMLPGAVYVPEGEAAIVDTKHKELKHVPTANHGPTSRWTTCL